MLLFLSILQNTFYLEKQLIYSDFFYSHDSSSKITLMIQVAKISIVNSSLLENFEFLFAFVPAEKNVIGRMTVWSANHCTVQVKKLLFVQFQAIGNLSMEKIFVNSSLNPKGYAMILKTCARSQIFTQWIQKFLTEDFNALLYVDILSPKNGRAGRFKKLKRQILDNFHIL